MKSSHGKLKAVVGLVLRRSPDVAQTDVVVIKGFAEPVAVGGETFLDLRSLIGEECEGHRLGQAAAVRAQKFVDLSALVSDGLVRGVYGVDQEDDVNRVLATATSLEGRDALRSLVVK